jgi:hypothetical protein
VSVSGGWLDGAGIQTPPRRIRDGDAILAPPFGTGSPQGWTSQDVCDSVKTSQAVLQYSEEAL